MLQIFDYNNLQIKINKQKIIFLNYAKLGLTNFFDHSTSSHSIELEWKLAQATHE